MGHDHTYSYIRMDSNCAMHIVNWTTYLIYLRAIQCALYHELTVSVHK